MKIFATCSQVANFQAKHVQKGTEIPLKDPYLEYSRLEQIAESAYKKGDYSTVIHRTLRMMDLNRNQFFGNMIQDPENNLFLNALSKYNKRKDSDKIHQIKNTALSHLDYLYPRIATEAYKLIKKA